VSKDLYYTIPRYFLERMHEHSNVRRVENVSTDEFFLYRIYRLRQDDSVLVWLSDAYRFTDMDFENRPRELAAGDYILVAKPEGSLRVSPELVAEARIGVGKLAEMMGALRKRDMWAYERPSRDSRTNAGRRY
jgi:hypothetical protein